MKLEGPLSLLKSAPSALVGAILTAEIIAFYLAPTTEHIPSPPPLRTFMADVGPWKLAKEVEIDTEAQNLLKADDTLNRFYDGAEGELSLFVGFFKSQRGGVTPHSPKICLPGSGWTPEESTTIAVDISGRPKPIPVNRYLVRRGENRSVVLYWYATAHHEIADEYLSKLYLMREGLFHRRSDEAVFRVISPVGAGGEPEAEGKAIRFIQASYPTLKRQIWSN
jgi:EpsI family protein